MKKLLFLILIALFPSSSFALSGSCSFPWNYNIVYTCNTGSPNMVYYSFTGSQEIEYSTYHTVVYDGTNYNIQARKVTFWNSPFTINWTDAITPGPQGATWSTGATGSIGPQGATGSVIIDGTISQLNLTLSGGITSPIQSNSFPSYSGVVLNGYFNTQKFHYDSPSFNLILYLNAFGDLSSSFYDVILVGTGWLEFTNAVTIQDVSSPRIVLTISRTDPLYVIECGWYGVEVPPSLIQWFSGWALPNPQSIGTAFEVTWCPWYDDDTPPTFILTWSTLSGSFVPPSASGFYIPILTEQYWITYLDWPWIITLSVFLIGLSFLLMLFYNFVYKPIRNQFSRWKK